MFTDFLLKLAFYLQPKETESPLSIKKCLLSFQGIAHVLPSSFLAAGHKSWVRLLRLLRIVPQLKVYLLRSSTNNNILSWLIVHL